ncbi:MAG: SRPBCC family protein [Polaromonas sp.]
MASIRKEALLAAPVEQVWAALRDVGALHTRLVPGFVTDCILDDNTRIVTFANGMVARELMVDISEAERRVVWSSVGGKMTHHNASAQVFAEGTDATRLVWIADFLPNEFSDVVSAMIGQGLAAMQRHFSGST